MKCLLVAHDNGYAGGDRCFVEQVKAIRELNSDLELYIILPEQGVLEPILLPLNIKDIVYIKQPWWIQNPKVTLRRYLELSLGFISSFIKTFIFVMKLKPDFVVSNTMAIPIPALVSKVMRIKHYWFIHEYGDRDHAMLFLIGKLRTLNLISRLSLKIIANTEGVAKQFLDQSNVFVLPYAMDMEIKPMDVKNISNGAKLIISGRISPEKGQFLVLKAFKILIDRGVAVKLTILGWKDDSYTSGLNEYINQHALEQYIERIEYQENPLPIVKAHDILVVCSKCEAFGRVTVEAMKLGLVVVGSATCGTKDIISDNENGLLFERDNQLQLADKIHSLIRDEVLFKKLQINSYESSLSRFNMNSYKSKLNKMLLNFTANES